MNTIHFEFRSELTKQLAAARTASAQRILPLILLLSTLLVAEAQFTFTTNSGTITITGYAGPGGPVVIPSATNGLLVTQIASQAFDSQTNVTSVTIPNTVTTIGIAAFFNCINLTNIFLPSSVTWIYWDAFGSCTSLTDITIPDSVRYLGPRACASCYSLVNVNLSHSIDHIDNETFKNCTNLTTVTIPRSVTNIYGGVFYNCTSLTNISIPDSVTDIRGYAFQYSGLTSVVIPDSVYTLGVYAFASCPNLVRVAIGDRVGSIGGSAFEGCPRLTTVIIGKSAYYFGGYAFAYCPRLTEVYVKGNASPSATWSVFYNDTTLTIYYLPGTSGWSPSWFGHPAALWNPELNVDSVGRPANPLGLTITGTADIPIALESCTNLVDGTWRSLQSCTLTNGSIYFRDSEWTNHFRRFYRIRSP